MKIYAALLGTLYIGFVCSGNVIADERADPVIARAVAAYGGDAFQEMQNFVLREKFKRFAYGQSYDPLIIDADHNDAVVTVDFTNDRKDLKWFMGLKPDFVTQHQMYDGDTGYRINHDKRTAFKNSAIDFARTDRRITYHLDTYLVRLMLKTRENALYDGQAVIKGVAHDVIKFRAEGYPEMTLYFNSDTGFLVQMTRPDRGEDKHIYQYASHKEQDGIHYATETYVARGGNPSFVTTYRAIDFNEDVNGTFALPEGYGPEAPALDFLDMMVEQLGDGVYLAGQNWGFSLFIDAGDHYIAAGGYAGLKDRLKAVQAFAGNEKPLEYQIVSHHHWDHVGGMTEAAELGANFIIMKEHVDTVRERAAIDIPDERFDIVEGNKSIANGLVRVLDFPNEHASHNLLTYIPSTNLVFSADLFLSRQASGAPDGYEDLRRLKAAISKAGFDVKRFAAAHSGRILTADDLNASINKISESVCPQGWVQCSE